MTMTTIAQMTMRVLLLVLLVLGVLFWTGHALTLINVHMLLGVLFVIALWTLSGIAAASHQPVWLVVVGVAWGLLVLVLGVTQQRLLPGSAHWVIDVLHLLIGLAALGLGETLAGRVRSRST